MSEMITGPALKHKGIIYTKPIPARHGDLFKDTGGKLINAEQGFVTSTGRFVNRKEGLLIAKASNQFIKPSGNPNDDKLYSEDMW